MSALRTAEARAGGAIERLERALRARPAGGALPEPSVLERDCERLRQECSALRSELAAATERSQRLTEIVAQAEERIDDAIERVDGIAEARATP